jgi:hypothetical protein
MKSFAYCMFFGSFVIGGAFALIFSGIHSYLGWAMAIFTLGMMLMASFFIIRNYFIPPIDSEHPQ